MAKDKPKYYWFANCGSCGEQIPIAVAVDPQRNPFPEADSVKKTCSECQAEQFYKPREFKLGQE